jgi:hypothetical protein
VAAAVVRRLLEDSLLREEDAASCASKLEAGSSTGEDWRLWLEKALEGERNRDSN